MIGAAPAALARRPVTELGGATVDLVVVGGGITGAGVARHAAAAGLSTLLLEADDFGAGTSSRSTKLIHGGLRYLAMGDFALVREGALERKSLLAMAPHLVEPRWMLVPARGRLEQLKLRVGIGLYERLGAVERNQRHRNLGPDDVAREEPLLDRQKLRRACLYREYLTDDARLVIAMLRAAAADGATICNHAAVTALTPASGGCRVDANDVATGESVAVTARCVVNAAGPWVESLLPPLAGGSSRLYLSKGVHVVLPRERLPVRHMVMMTAADGRPVFAIARGAVTYLGTTDTPHRGGAEHWPEVTAADVSYLLETANRHFHGPPLQAGEVLTTWAGLRPLIHQPGKAPKEMSRRDEIWREGVVVTVAGGKLTGFRRMAEDAMEAVGAILGRPVAMPQPLAAVPGGDVPDVAALTADLGQRYHLERRVAERLVRLYGSEAPRVLGERPTPLSPSVFAGEVDWAVAVEGARTLEDVIFRRVRAAWFLPDEVDTVVAGAAPIVAARLGWSEAAAATQVGKVRRRLAHERHIAAVALNEDATPR